MGSCLPRLGLSATQLDAILNRQDTDTAHEAFVALKASREASGENGDDGLPFGSGRPVADGKRKRWSTSDDPRPKSNSDPVRSPERHDSADTNDAPVVGPSTDFEAFSYLFPGQSSVYNATAPQPNYSAPYSALPFSMPMTSNNLSTLPYGQNNSDFGQAAPLPMSRYPGLEVFMGDSPDGAESERQRQLRAAVSDFTGGEATPQQVMEKRRMEEDLQNRYENGDSDRKAEAYQLISYHINK